MYIQKAINELLNRHDLNDELMTSTMQEIMTGKATDAQIGGFLLALRMKGEVVGEITAAAKVMRSLATPVNLQVNREHLVDTCGTGGDNSGIFNVSTASAFVVAAAGGIVAKHGNRSISSKSGSADLLEAAGVCLTLSAEQVARCVESIGIGFMFAQQHHSAMKYAIGPRKELATRTLFNVLGPLTNPAGAPNQVLGVFSREWLIPLANVLQQLGSEHVLVVHSYDGLDEISSAEETTIVELKDEKIIEYTVKPEDFGLVRTDLKSLTVTSIDESLVKVKCALTDAASPEAAIVSLNAGAAIYAANICGSLSQGVAMAQDIISTGLAHEKLKELVDFTQHLQELNK